ncbi:MAG TPA: nucleotide-binding protein [Kofleriaceae bacterium]|nr:nucleotide-binding protein [Kofleriaceae bacterium]
MDRPRVFVGSSTEGLSLAMPLAEILRDVFDARLWKGEGVFKPGTYTLETFEEELRKCDFAVIVGKADDVLTKREETTAAVRDNLVFEFGMFVGVLGRRRTFLVIPADVDLNLPTDLDGLSFVKYEPQAVGTDERQTLLVVQRVAGDLRNAIDDQCVQAREEDRQRKLRASARVTAMGRLQDVIVQLRDLLVELPTEALAALGDRKKFESVKAAGAAKIDRLYESWAPDAEIVGVKNHFDLLARATKRAVDEFPYPESVVMSKGDLQKRISSILSVGSSAFHAGESLFGAVRAEAESELEARLRAVQEQYAAWWRTHSAELRRNTMQLQDALTAAAISLGRAETSRS